MLSPPYMLYYMLYLYFFNFFFFGLGIPALHKNYEHIKGMYKINTAVNY